MTHPSGETDVRISFSPGRVKVSVKVELLEEQEAPAPSLSGANVVSALLSASPSTRALIKFPFLVTTKTAVGSHCD